RSSEGPNRRAALAARIRSTRRARSGGAPSPPPSRPSTGGTSDVGATSHGDASASRAAPVGVRHGGRRRVGRRAAIGAGIRAAVAGGGGRPSAPAATPAVGQRDVSPDDRLRLAGVRVRDDQVVTRIRGICVLGVIGLVLRTWIVLVMIHVGP